jgi:RNA polymerase sigma-70 factor (ECF subfamily)
LNEVLWFGVDRRWRNACGAFFPVSIFSNHDDWDDHVGRFGHGRAVLRLVDERSRAGILGVPRGGLVVTARPSLVSNEATRFRALVDEHFEFVWRSVRRLGVPAADADDAAQEVFVVAAKKLGSIEADRERAFLFGTAARVASTRRRTRRRHPEDPAETLDARPLEGDMSPEDRLERSQARALLQRILDGMSEDQRAVFVLAELEETSVREIAELLELPLGTVSSRLRAARETFATEVRRLLAREAFSWRKR